jgi:hypothetical protein
MVSSLRHGANYPSCIHGSIDPCTKEEEEATFARHKTSHMETDYEEQKAPKMTKQIPLVQLITLQIINKS